MESLRSFAPHDHRQEQVNERKLIRGESNVRARHIVARHLHLSTAVVQSKHGASVSQRTCRALARDAGKANSYQFYGG